MSQVRFLDQVSVSSFDTTTASNVGTGSLLVTASESPDGIIFTKGDNSTFTVDVGGSVTGSLLVTGSVTNNVLTFEKGDGSTFNLEVATDVAISASYAATASIRYETASGDTYSLSNIQVNDYDDNVAVTFVNGKLTFTFGTPEVPTSINTSLSGFATNRFNKVEDDYSVNATWVNGGYNLISASLYEGSTLLQKVGSGTSLTFNTTTSGSHTYVLHYTASSPLDGSLYKTTDSVSGTLSKTNPGNPSISSTPTVQLGGSSNQIEQGATGSIVFSAAYGSANGWEEVSLSTTPSTSPISVTDSNTGSLSISISATSNYQSPTGENDPQLTTSRNSTTTYSKIRSVRYGASAASSFTQAELETLSDWDTGLGGSVGTIDKGNTNPSGDSITITWSGDKYHYIVYDANRSNLSSIVSSGFEVIGQFTLTTVGDYKVYKTSTLQSGYAGTNITYILT